MISGSLVFKFKIQYVMDKKALKKYIKQNPAEFEKHPEFFDDEELVSVMVYI